MRVGDIKTDSEPVAKAPESKDAKERVCTTVLSCLIVYISAFMMGCTLGYSSPVLLELESERDPELRFNSVLSGLFGASALVGGVFGAPLSGWVADKWGRKISLMVGSLPYVIGYFFIVSSSIANPVGFKVLLFVGRFISGIGVGWTFVATPVYIGEVSSAKLRGVLGSFLEVSVAVGAMFVYAFGLIPNFHYYHLAVVLEGVMLLYVVLVVWIPETPRWLLVKHEEEWAAKVMVYLRGSTATKLIESETEDIKDSICKTPHLTLLQSLKQLRWKHVLIPVLLVITVMVLQEVTGITIVTSYAAPILRDAGVSNPDLLGAFAAGGAWVAATVVGAFLIDLLGRKVLLLLSAAGMFTAVTMLGSHFYITRPVLCANSTDAVVPLADTFCNTQYAPLAVVSVVLFMVSFAVGWGPVPWVIMSEYLPLQVRGIGSGISIMCAWGSAGLVTGVFPVYVDLVRPWFAWWTLSIINLVAFVFVVAFIVETKGKSLEDIQRHFEWKHSKKVRSPELPSLPCSPKLYQRGVTNVLALESQNHDDEEMISSSSEDNDIKCTAL